MMKTRQGFSFTILFYILLLCLLVYSHSVSIYILEKAKESDDSSKTTSLSFNISGGVDQGFNEDKFFKIKTEIYRDTTLLETKNTECKIPSSPQATFGTQLIIRCEIDLISSKEANNIKFIEFVQNENDDPKINDINKHILGNILSFSKKIEVKFDIEFIAESIKFVKCLEDKYIFSLKGQYTSNFIRSFSFDLPLNDNEQLKAKCESPNIYVPKDELINCTLIMLKDDKFKESLKKGIQLKESYYNTININDEKKILKIKIKNNKKNISLNEITCNTGGIYDYFKSVFAPKKQTEEIKKEDEEQNNWEKQREEERRRRKEKEEREREEAKKRRDQEDLENLLKRREKEREEQEKKRKYDIDNNDKNNNNPTKFEIDIRNQKNDDEIDYNSNVKLIHLQVRYSNGYIYYMFYALTPIHVGHKIKVRFSITKYDYDSGFNNQEYKYIILKTEDGISTNEKNIIVEYMAKYDCEQCKKMIIDKNSIQGATIYNIPDDQYFLDAISTNKNTYLSKSTIQNPPLYITDNLYSQNCLIYLSGNFFNKNIFFASKFSLTLIGTDYYNNRNVTVYCGLNERSVFTCPINTNLINFEYKVEKLIVDQKENIIIDNSIINRNGMINRVNCQVDNNNFQNNDNKPKEPLEEKKGWNWKRIIIIILVIIVLYYLISKYCCEKEEEYSDEYNSRWRVSSSNYSGGETYGLRSRGW